MVNNDTLPPSCPEAERGVLGCCLLNTSKTGVSSRWFYDLRHIEIFNVLAAMARNGGGDSLVATLKAPRAGQARPDRGPCLPLRAPGCRPQCREPGVLPAGPTRLLSKTPGRRCGHAPQAPG
jgi:hypothetical protein